jgi:hypothetical protein
MDPSTLDRPLTICKTAAGKTSFPAIGWVWKEQFSGQMSWPEGAAECQSVDPLFCDLPCCLHGGGEKRGAWLSSGTVQYGQGG